MKSLMIQSWTNTEIGMVITVNDEDYEKAKELAIAGFSAWLCPDGEIDSRLVKIYGEDANEVIENVGYFEPTEGLLRDANIEYEIDYPFKEDGTTKEEYEEIPVIY